MKLTFIDRKDIPKRQGYKNTKLLEVLKEFTDSEMTAARVDDHGYKDPAVAVQALNASAKRFNMTGIKAITRNRTLYLIKEI
jgi:hypothetical protein